MEEKHISKRPQKEMYVGKDTCAQFILIQMQTGILDLKYHYSHCSYYMVRRWSDVEIVEINSTIKLVAIYSTKDSLWLTSIPY